MEIDMHPELEAMMKQQFVSATSPLADRTNNNPASSLATPERKRNESRNNNETPTRDSRIVKKLKQTKASDSDHLYTYLLGEISQHYYGAALDTLVSLTDDLHNLEDQQLANIPNCVATLSNHLKLNELTFEKLQNVLRKLLNNPNFNNSDDLKQLYNKNQLALNRYKLKKALENKNYEKAIDVFIELSGDNARIIFPDEEIFNIYTELTSNTVSTDKSYRLDELQKIMGRCIQSAEDLKPSIRLYFLNPALQELYYHNQSILHGQNKEYLHQIDALFMYIPIAGSRLKLEANQPEQQQQTAIRIHQSLAEVEKIIKENPDCEQFLYELLIIKNNLSDDFINISPIHCTTNDWKMIDLSYYAPQTWTQLYNAAVQDIKNSAKETPHKIQTLILFMEFDQVSNSSVTFLRIITLYQRLFNILQKTPDNLDNKVQFDLMLKNIDRLSRAIESNDSISEDDKEAVRETKNTFLSNNIFNTKNNNLEKDTASTSSTMTLTQSFK
jgi:hypothetical protein